MNLLQVPADLKLRTGELLDSQILVVDDAPANLRALSLVLELAGYRHVRCLSDSREVIPAVEDTQPDLILLDLHMPHLDGLGVLQQLPDAVPEGDYIPVLVLTGDGTAEAKERALSLGASDFLSKPLSHTEVELRVRNLLQSRWLHQQLRGQNARLAQQVLESTALAEEVAAAHKRLSEAQAHLVQSEKMASLGQLVAGIAHEINNPLAFVLNNIFIVQEMLNKLEADLHETPAPVEARLQKTRARLNDMHLGAERVRDLVSKLRTFSRLDEGKFKTVDIHESIDLVLLFVQHKTEGRIEVKRHYGPDGQLSCFAGELNQVLMNLISNAIDAIQGKGEITISTRQEDGSFVIVIRDSGQGIPEHIRSRIFEPFFTTKPIGVGTGLGLAISYGVINAHRGSIDFTTEMGEGTEFVVKIPLSLGEGVPTA